MFHPAARASIPPSGAELLGTLSANVADESAPRWHTVRTTMSAARCRPSHHRAGRTTLTVAFSTGLALLAACARKDLSTEFDSVRSWTATTHLAAGRRDAGAINGAVARQLVDRATEARTQFGQSLGQLATTDSDRATARAVLDSLRQGIAQLQETER